VLEQHPDEQALRLLSAEDRPPGAADHRDVALVLDLPLHAFELGDLGLDLADLVHDVLALRLGGDRQRERGDDEPRGEHQAGAAGRHGTAHVPVQLPPPSSVIVTRRPPLPTVPAPATSNRPDHETDHPEPAPRPFAVPSAARFPSTP
jgi:hypothetical protein